MLVESGGDNLTATFSRGLADQQIFVLDVSGGDKVPRKGGPGVTFSDLLVINKTDLAPLVGASLEVMARDASAVREGRPVLFTSLREDPLADAVADGCGPPSARRPSASPNGPMIPLEPTLPPAPADPAAAIAKMMDRSCRRRGRRLRTRTEARAAGWYGIGSALGGDRGGRRDWRGNAAAGAGVAGAAGVAADARGGLRRRRGGRADWRGSSWACGSRSARGRACGADSRGVGRAARAGRA